MADSASVRQCQLPEFVDMDMLSTDAPTSLPPVTPSRPSASSASAEGWAGIAIRHDPNDPYLVETPVNEERVARLRESVKSVRSLKRKRAVTPQASQNSEFISVHSLAAPRSAPAKSKQGSKSEASTAGPQAEASVGDSSGPSVPSFIPPWHKSGGRYSLRPDSFMFGLHEEIMDFVEYISPTEAERQKRLDVVERIRALTTELWPDSSLLLFGSFATDLYLPTSDVDLVLLGVADGKKIEPALQQLAKKLRKNDMVTYVEVIGKARVPIVKFTDRVSGLDVDLCMSQEGGLRAAKFIRDVQRKLPALRPLTLILKYFLHCRSLNDTYSGGVGSWLLQLMLIHLLQMHPLRNCAPPQKGHFDEATAASWNHNVNLGALLFAFMEYYGVHFNYLTLGISVLDTGSYFNKTEKGWDEPERPMLLSVEDPLTPENDVGRNSFAVYRIRRAFRWAYQQLVAATLPQAVNGPSALSRLLAITDDLLLIRPSRTSAQALSSSSSSPGGGSSSLSSAKPSRSAVPTTNGADREQAEEKKQSVIDLTEGESLSRTSSKSRRQKDAHASSSLRIEPTEDPAANRRIVFTVDSDEEQPTKPPAKHNKLHASHPLHRGSKHGASSGASDSDDHAASANPHGGQYSDSDEEDSRYNFSRNDPSRHGGRGSWSATPSGRDERGRHGGRPQRDNRDSDRDRSRSRSRSRSQSRSGGKHKSHRGGQRNKRIKTNGSSGSQRR